MGSGTVSYRGTITMPHTVTVTEHITDTKRYDHIIVPKFFYTKFMNSYLGIYEYRKVTTPSYNSCPSQSRGSTSLSSGYFHMMIF